MVEITKFQGLERVEEQNVPARSLLPLTSGILHQQFDRGESKD